MSRVDQFPKPFKQIIPAPGQSGISKETQAVLDKLSAMINTLWDVTVIANATAFVRLSNSTPLDIDPPATGVAATSAQKAYENKLDRPMVVVATVESDGAGGSLHLLLAFKDADATLANAAVRDYGPAPKIWLVVPPNTSIFVNCSSPNGSGAAVRVLVTAIPLIGRRLVEATK